MTAVQTPARSKPSRIRDIQGLSFQAPTVSLDQVGTSRRHRQLHHSRSGHQLLDPLDRPDRGRVPWTGSIWASTAALCSICFDLDSVEILRGPQGVLFGPQRDRRRGGDQHRQPDRGFPRQVFRAAVDGPAVDGGRGGANYTASGVVSGPIIEDTLLFKVGAYYNKDEGYFRNLASLTDPNVPENHGKAETKILRGALEGRFGDLMIRGKLDYFESDGDGPSAQNRAFFDRKQLRLRDRQSGQLLQRDLDRIADGGMGCRPRYADQCVRLAPV